MNNLDDIKNRLAAATPGPWEVGGMDSGHSKFETNWWVTAGEGDTICDMDGLSRSNNEAVALDDGFADAEFIAHAPEDIAYLLAEVERISDQLNWMLITHERYQQLAEGE